MIAPTLGALILKFTIWRSIFSVLAGGGILLLIVVTAGFEESAKIEKADFTPKSVLMNYAAVLSNRVSCGYAIVNALMFGGLFTYVSNCSLLFMNVFHISPQLFGVLFAFTASGIMIGAFVNGKLSVRNVAHHKPLIAGLVMASVATLTGVVLNITNLIGVYQLVAIFFVCTFSMGLVAPNAAHGCMHPLPKIAGVAAAVLASIQMITGAAASALVSVVYDGKSAFAMTTVMTVFIVSSLVSYLLIVRTTELAASNS
jgi:DHA1 family bicyclomycin/chloramphenicol resistance-like MFS transporter